MEIKGSKTICDRTDQDKSIVDKNNDNGEKSCDDGGVIGGNNVCIDSQDSPRKREGEIGHCC